jgi:hypothetical protein
MNIKKKSYRLHMPGFSGSTEAILKFECLVLSIEVRQLQYEACPYPLDIPHKEIVAVCITVLKSAFAVRF